MKRAPIRYVDRATGELRDEKIYAHAFLHWCYNTRPGLLLTDLLLRRRWVSRAYGWTQRRAWSRRRIRPFVERFGIDTGEMIRPLNAFASFAEFFEREIDLSHRQIRREPGVCIAPADGRALAYEGIDPRQTFRIKGSDFDLGALVGDERIAERHAGGSAFITRLYICDYHHVHFPDAGTCSRAVPIQGGLYAVSPYGRRSHPPFYSENFRMRSELRSENFGTITMVEIGAFTVGSIRHRYEPGARVGRADRKAVFELGGSTVVMLFEPGRIRFDADLLDNTARGLETYVKLGESIGTNSR